MEGDEKHWSSLGGENQKSRCTGNHGSTETSSHRTDWGRKPMFRHLLNCFMRHLPLHKRLLMKRPFTQYLFFFFFFMSSTKKIRPIKMPKTARRSKISHWLIHHIFLDIYKKVYTNILPFVVFLSPNWKFEFCWSSSESQEWKGRKFWQSNLSWIVRKLRKA